MELSSLESVEVRERSSPQTSLLSDGLYFDFGAVFLRHKTRWRLAGQVPFQLLDDQLGVWRRLCVARQNQPPLIDGRNPNIDHFNFGQLLQHRRRCQPRGVQQQALLQRHLQTVSEEGDQNVRVGAMLQLMIDGAYAEFALERSEDRFDLGQLHVTAPKHAGISGRKVGAQQVMSVTPFRLLEFFLIYTKLEGLARDLLAFLWYLHLHEPESAARCCFRSAQAHQQLDQRGQAAPHGTELSEQAS